MRVLARVVATIGAGRPGRCAAIVWWTGRSDHSQGDAEVADRPRGALGHRLPAGRRRPRRRAQFWRPAAARSPTTATVRGGASPMPPFDGGRRGRAARDRRLDPPTSGTDSCYAYLPTPRERQPRRSLPSSARSPGEPILDRDQRQANNHDGGRIRVRSRRDALRQRPGDAGDPDSAQDPDSLNGKILRITPARRRSQKDNPDTGQPRLLARPPQRRGDHVGR